MLTNSNAKVNIVLGDLGSNLTYTKFKINLVKKDKLSLL